MEPASVTGPESLAPESVVPGPESVVVEGPESVVVTGVEPESVVVTGVEPESSPDTGVGPVELPVWQQTLPEVPQPKGRTAVHEEEAVQ